MHTIYDCVNSFCSLLDTEYHLVLGRKGVAVKMAIRFGKKDCFHLMGLQYLTDMPNLSRDRGKIFDEIMEQKITQRQVELSDHYQKIAERVDLLPQRIVLRWTAPGRTWRVILPRTLWRLDLPGSAS